MKKQWLALITACLLAFTPALGAMAQTEFTLPEKMQKQVNAGSGLKGTLTLSGLPGYDGLQMDVQYIAPKEQSQLLLTLVGGGSEIFKAALYKAEDALVLDTSAASGQIYALPGGWETLLSYLLEGKDETANTPWYTALKNILSPEDTNAAAQLTAAAAPYLTKVDLWMQAFATQPVSEKDANGLTVMKHEYQIPVAAFKAELKQLLIDLLADKALLKLLWAQVSQDQADLYLNPALQSFYFQAVDALPLDGNILLTRRVSTLGQVLETAVSLPFSGAVQGMKRISLTQSAAQEGDTLTCTIEEEKGNFTFSFHETATKEENVKAYAGVIRYLPAEIPNWQVDATLPQYEGKALSVGYQAVYTKASSTDAEGKNNESYELAIDFTPDWSHLAAEPTEEVKAQYILTIPAKLSLSALFKSSQARNASTAIETGVSFVSGDTNVKLSGQFKTTPPWTFQPVDASKAIPLNQMTQEELTAWALQTLISQPGLLNLMPFLVQEEQPAPDSVG